jgi:hypothetical protein
MSGPEQDDPYDFTPLNQGVIGNPSDWAASFYGTGNAGSNFDFDYTESAPPIISDEEAMTLYRLVSKFERGPHTDIEALFRSTPSGETDFMERPQGDFTQGASTDLRAPTDFGGDVRDAPTGSAGDTQTAFTGSWSDFSASSQPNASSHPASPSRELSPEQYSTVLQGICNQPDPLAHSTAAITTISAQRDEDFTDDEDDYPIGLSVGYFLGVQGNVVPFKVSPLPSAVTLLNM